MSLSSFLVSLFYHSYIHWYSCILYNIRAQAVAAFWARSSCHFVLLHHQTAPLIYVKGRDWQTVIDRSVVYMNDDDRRYIIFSINLLKKICIIPYNILASLSIVYFFKFNLTSCDLLRRSRAKKIQSHHQFFHTSAHKKRQRDDNVYIMWTRGWEHWRGVSSDTHLLLALSNQLKKHPIDVKSKTHTHTHMSSTSKDKGFFFPLCIYNGFLCVAFAFDAPLKINVFECLLRYIRLQLNYRECRAIAVLWWWWWWWE